MTPGKGAEKAMEVLRALGRIYEAQDMVEVGSVQVSGVSYKNIGEHGLAFLEEWAGMGSKAVVPAAMNPGGADRRLWKSLGWTEDFVRKQERVIRALEALGIRPALTCTPYHAGMTPARGEHIAWAESSAVCYANSVLGARTNREGGPSAIAAALTGKTPNHGLHTDEGRRPTRVIRVECEAPTAADAGALGTLIGRAVAEDERGGVPFIAGVKPPDTAWLKALGAGMAAAGSVGLFYFEGEAPAGLPETRVESLGEAVRSLSTGGGAIDVAAVGCPHASREDLERIASLLGRGRVKTPLWVFVSEAVRSGAGRLGSELESRGAVLVADTCIVVAPLKDLGIRCVATDSAKAAFYLPSHQGVSVRFGPLERVVGAALRGGWDA
jgi:predicted aconitase